MNSNELSEFWSGKDYKIYVVTLRHARGRIKPETRYVRVRSPIDSVGARHRAAKVAIANSVDFSPSVSLDYSARLADPERDLGCVRSGVAA